MKKAEIAKVTPELEAYCTGLWEKYKLSDTVPYNPWKEKQDIVVFPGAIGGGNWQGVMFNQPLGLMITNVMNAGQWGHLEERAGAGAVARGGRGGGPRRWRGRRRAAGSARSNVDAAAAPRRRAEHEQGDARRRPLLGTADKYSCAQPPWGELIAVNANTGDIAWRVPLGEFPELEAKGIKTGQPSLGGGITTAGNLVFIGATIDGIFRAIRRAQRQRTVAREARGARALDSVDAISARTASSTSRCRQAAAGSSAVRRRTPSSRGACSRSSHDSELDLGV